MSNTPEARLTNKMLARMNAVEGCRAEKIHASQFGMPKLDVFGAYKGKMFYLEIKIPGNKPTPRQVGTIKRWKEEAGVHTGWVDTVDGAMEFLNELSE